MDIRNACLVLKTSDLTVNTSNQIGSCDAYRQNMTWNNINLRSVLGDLYDLYDYFNLSLYFISTDTSSTLANGNYADKAIYMKIGGLPFSNQTYNVKNRSNGTLATLCTFNMPGANGTVQQNFYGSNYLTFAKNQEQVNINIQYTRLQDDVPYDGTGALSYPNVTFIFHIFGVPKTNDKNGTRMEI